MVEHAVSQPHDLPVGPTVGRGVGIWGMWTVIATEAALFAYLLFSYFYLGAQGSAGWLLEPHPLSNTPCRAQSSRCCHALARGRECEQFSRAADRLPCWHSA